MLEKHAMKIEVKEAKKSFIADIAIAKDFLNKALAMAISIDDDTVNTESLADQANRFIRNAHEHTSRAVAGSLLLQMRTAKDARIQQVTKAE